MNDLEQFIIKRRSTKRYTDAPVPDEVIRRICEVGTYAATGRGRQSPIILAVTNKELRDRLSRMNAEIMGATGDPFYGAPVVLVVLADKNVNTRVYDGSLVMGNLMLAAEAEALAVVGSTARGRSSRAKRARRFCARSAWRASTRASATACWATPPSRPSPPPRGKRIM